MPPVNPAPTTGQQIIPTSLTVRVGDLEKEVSGVSQNMQAELLLIQQRLTKLEEKVG